MLSLLQRITHSSDEVTTMRDAENHGLDRAHSFSNEDGFEEWMTCDANGNEVHCYDKGSVEIHTKEPL